MFIISCSAKFDLSLRMLIFCGFIALTKTLPTFHMCVRVCVCVCVCVHDASRAHYTPLTILQQNLSGFFVITMKLYTSLVHSPF